MSIPSQFLIQNLDELSKKPSGVTALPSPCYTVTLFGIDVGGHSIFASKNSLFKNNPSIPSAKADFTQGVADSYEMPFFGRGIVTQSIILCKTLCLATL